MKQNETDLPDETISEEGDELSQIESILFEETTAKELNEPEDAPTKSHEEEAHDEESEHEEELREEEVKTWLSEERSRINIIKPAKPRLKREIFRSPISSKKKETSSKKKETSLKKKEARKSGLSLPANILVSQLDSIIESAIKKSKEIKEAITSRTDELKKLESGRGALLRGDIKNNYTDFLHSLAKSEQEIIQNLITSSDITISLTKLESLLDNSCERELRIRQLVAGFARDFINDHFPAEEETSLRTVDIKIRESKKEKDFYDLMTALTYRNLLTELAFRCAIILTVPDLFKKYKTALLSHPLHYSRYETTDKLLLDKFTSLFSRAFSELTISRDDSCPEDADDNLKMAYAINTAMAELFERLVPSVGNLAEKTAELKDFLASEENYKDDNTSPLIDLLSQIESAAAEYEAVLGLESADLTSIPSTPALTEFRNYLKTDLITINGIISADNYADEVPGLLTILSFRESMIEDLVRAYVQAKEKQEDYEWKSLTAKEKYFPDADAMISALVNLFQCENEWNTLMGPDMSVPAREIVEKHYRRATGLFEIIFRSITSIATYIYNVLSYQSADIAQGAPDGELARILSLSVQVAADIHHKYLGDHFMDSQIFIYKTIFNDPKNSDLLYYAEAEEQISHILHKYLHVTEMPYLQKASEAMAKMSSILEKYKSEGLPASKIPDIMDASSKKEMSTLISLARTTIDSYKSWHRNSGIGSIYNLYDFTIYSPESLIKKADARELAIMYLSGSESNLQGRKLRTAEQEIRDGLKTLSKSDQPLYLRLTDCAKSYRALVRMYQQFYTLFNERNTTALHRLEGVDPDYNDSKDLAGDAIFEKPLMHCSPGETKLIKDALMHFARWYAKFSHEYILLMEEYLNSLKSFYKNLPEIDHAMADYLKYINIFSRKVQTILSQIRTTLIIMQKDADPMISRSTKTLSFGLEKNWVGDLEPTMMTRIEEVLLDTISKANTKSLDNPNSLATTLAFLSAPLENWLKEKRELDNKLAEKKNKTQKSSEDNIKSTKAEKDDTTK
ncbi:hypothetical protein IKE72_02870 [Candidatus Saccharibacteria bacterium]|nr:hypothetical protein [Candidatus Saccharibacteria bacterium]